MKLKSSYLRNIVNFFPFPIPRSILQPLLDKNVLSYDCYTEEIIVDAKWGNNCLFKIKNIKEFIQRTIYFYGYYELKETLFVKKVLRHGDIFVDIGANIGWFTIIAANIVGDKGKVISFEPSSNIFKHLTENIKLQELGVSGSKYGIFENYGFQSRRGLTR